MNICNCLEEIKKEAKNDIYSNNKDSKIYINKVNLSEEESFWYATEIDNINFFTKSKMNLFGKEELSIVDEEGNLVDTKQLGIKPELILKTKYISNNNKEITEKISISLKYCPFCGDPYPKALKKEE